MSTFQIVVTWTVTACNLCACVYFIKQGNKYRRMRYGDRKAAGNRDDSVTCTVEVTGSLPAGLPGTAGTVGGTSDTGDDPGVAEKKKEFLAALAESITDVPILAYKRGTLMWSPGGTFALRGGYGGFPMSVDARAICMSTTHYSMYGYKEPPHGPVPGDRCRCGFYAHKTSEANERASYGLVKLDVELSGRVIVAETGYRAEHQRVLRAHIPDCYWCGDPAAHVAVIERVDGTTTAVEVRPLCAAHPIHEGGVVFAIAKVMESIGLPWESDDE